MGEVRLWTLRVVESTVADGAVGGPDRQLTAIKLVTRAIAELGGFVDNLIEGWEDIVSELHFSDRCSTSASCADSEAGDALLRQGSVKDAVSAILLIEAHSASEHTAKLDILTKDERAVVLLHGHVERVHDGRPEVHVLLLVWVLQLELFDVQHICKVMLLQLVLDEREGALRLQVPQRILWLVHGHRWLHQGVGSLES